MDRRSFVAATAAAATPALAAPAVAQTQNPEVRWRMQSSSSRNLDILFFGAEQVSKRVAELADNRFQTRAFPAGELEMVARYDASNPVAQRRLVGGGAQLRAWPREVLQAAWRATHELMEENASKNARFKRIWESYRPFRDDQFQWFRIAENSSDNFAFTAAATR